MGKRNVHIVKIVHIQIDTIQFELTCYAALAGIDQYITSTHARTRAHHLFNLRRYTHTMA